MLHPPGSHTGHPPSQRAVRAFQRVDGLDPRRQHEVDRLIHLLRAESGHVAVAVAHDASAHGDAVRRLRRQLLIELAACFATMTVFGTGVVSQPTIAGAVDEHGALIFRYQPCQRTDGFHTFNPALAIHHRFKNMLIQEEGEILLRITELLEGQAVIDLLLTDSDPARLLNDTGLTPARMVPPCTVDADTGLDAAVAAQRRTVLDQGGLRAVASGGNGSRDASRATANHDHVKLTGKGWLERNALEAGAFPAHRILVLGRDVVGVGGQQNRIATPVEAGQVMQGQLELALLESNRPTLLPCPCVRVGGAKLFAHCLAVNQHLEPPRGMVLHPIPRTDPNVVIARLRDIDHRRRVLHRLADPGCHHEGRPHEVDELRVHTPATVLVEVLRVHVEEAVHRHPGFGPLLLDQLEELTAPACAANQRRCHQSSHYFCLHVFLSCRCRSDLK